MQRARDPESSGADPVRVFLILAAVLVVIGAAIWLTRANDPETTPAADESPDFSLTDEEAIARFNTLDELRVRAIDEADVSLLSEVFVPGSRIEGITRNNIRRLKRTDVAATHRPYEVERVSVLANDPTSVHLEQVVLFDVIFSGPGGRDLTKQGGLERQTINWTLTVSHGEWLINAAQVTQADPQ